MAAGGGAEGRICGIGYAAVVEPSISNMGYIATVLTAEERRKAGPKNGAQATARFLSGTFADYLVPTACEVPVPVILHRESPSPVTPLGAKGVGEGNCMSTPVCLANAVADALSAVSVDEPPSLPITPAKLAALIHPPEPPRPNRRALEVADRFYAVERGRITLHGEATSSVDRARLMEMVAV